MPTNYFDNSTHIRSHVSISENSHVNALSRLASTIDNQVGRNVQVEVLARRNTTEVEVQVVQQKPSWMDLILTYLTYGSLQDDMVEAKLVRCWSTRYIIFHNILYQRNHSMPLLRCLWEVYDRARSLVLKTIRQGYYWPTLHSDALQLVKEYDKCQRFDSVPKLLAKPFAPIINLWYFLQWGLDLISPMPQGKR